MPLIQLETYINSSIEVCFDLARSVDLHIISTAKTGEKAIAGVTTGLMNLTDFVTWEATHLGIRQTLTSQITEMNRPFHFKDEQVKGAFKNFIHTHSFEVKNGAVLMKDDFEFVSPLGFIGNLFNSIFLTNYMTKLLVNRNKVIKEFAESEKWKSVLQKNQ